MNHFSLTLGTSSIRRPYRCARSETWRRYTAPRFTGRLSHLPAGNTLTTSKLTPKVHRRATFRFKNFFKSLGPGLITGASDDDPSGIGTYSQAGAQLGFGIGWTMSSPTR